MYISQIHGYRDPPPRWLLGKFGPKHFVAWMQRNVPHALRLGSLKLRFATCPAATCTKHWDSISGESVESHNARGYIVFQWKIAVSPHRGWQLLESLRDGDVSGILGESWARMDVSQTREPHHHSSQVSFQPWLSN
jgi:hypothetical protein